jgi:hypothetical protein
LRQEMADSNRGFSLTSRRPLFPAARILKGRNFLRPLFICIA